MKCYPSPRKGTGWIVGPDATIIQSASSDFAYLSAVRARDARSLKWADVGENEILIEPTKTRRSSGAKIAIVITPDILGVLERAKSIGKGLYVFHTLKGRPLAPLRSNPLGVVRASAPA